MRLLCIFLALLFLPACLTHKDIRKKEDVKKKASAPVGSQESSSAGSGGLSQRLSHIEDSVRQLRGDLESRDKAQKDRMDQIEQGLLALIQALDLRVASLTGAGQKTAKKKSTAVVKKPLVFEKAEKFFKQENWKSAIVHYEKYRAQNKKGKFYEQATLQIGLCFQQLKMQKEAKVFFREVVSSFPKSAFAKEAKKQLARAQKLSISSSPKKLKPGPVTKK